uniref:small monomeric GTPase n=1 Tax=Magallana gigas TaxID=29159 RepID=A0A8W8JHH0_MAGGI|nr:ras-related and estrogen-regulated growth inhibitor [Crassostrea gigas]
MNPGSGLSETNNSGNTLRPYLRRKKSSFGETKVAVIGTDGVGKSALSVRFLTKRFIGEYDQTVESKYKYTTTTDGETITFEVLDTISESEDCGARDDVLRWADGVLIVYSVVSRDTFDVIQDIRRRIDDCRKGASIPMVLLGNKCDLAHMRKVPQEEGQRLANEMGCPFLEVSASEDVDMVTDAFLILSREVVDFKRRSRTFFDRVFGAFGREKVST